MSGPNSRRGRKFRLSFLPLFFIILGVAFAFAVVIRLRSTAQALRPAQIESGTAAGQSSTTSATTSSVEAGSGTLAPFDLVPRPNATAAARLPISASKGERVVRSTPGPRSKRLEELLSAPLPARASRPAAAPKAVKPAGRPVTAQAAASPPRQPTPPNRPAVSPADATRAAQHESGAGRSVSNEPARSVEVPAPKEKDPSSDNTPPYVATVEFNPAQVHDGEETVMTVSALDDLSGVRNISGSIASPSGALQGFALARENDGPRWVSRVSVPKDAAEGVWKVQFLSLTDNASNTVSLSSSQGTLPATASFRVVSSRPDSAGPGLKAIWVDKPAMRAGEKNTVFVQADDDKSGVNLVSGVFQSPAHRARIGFGCRSGNSGAWECDIAAPVCLDCGVWQLEQVQLQDKANNMTTLRIDNPLVSAVRIDITGDQCDNTAPILQSVALDQLAVRNTDVSTITVTATVSDDFCGVSSVSGQAANVQTPAQTRIYFSFQNAGDANTFVGRITVPRLAAKGVWNVSWVQLLDKGHNLRTYSSAEPVLQGASFRVE